jgi:hypothetical protein
MNYSASVEEEINFYVHLMPQLMCSFTIINLKTYFISALLKIMEP